MPWPLDNQLAEPTPDTSRVPSRKGYGHRAIYSVIDPEDETFAQGLQEDEWIVENVDWLTDMFFEVGIPLETSSYRYFTVR